MALTPEQAAQILAQAGFTGEALVQMVAIAKRESGYNPEAHRTNTDPAKMVGDFGLLQINYVNIPGLKAAGIINGPQDLLDPVKNAKAAFYLSKQGTNLSPWSAQAGVGYSVGGNPLAGTNVNDARAAVQSAQAQGLIGQSYAGADTSTANGATTGAVSSSTDSAFQLPTDLQVYSVPDSGAVWAVYEGPGGVKIAFDVHGTQAQYDQAKAKSISSADFNALGTVNGGSATELVTTSKNFGTFGAQWNATIDQVMGKYNPARNDPGVNGVIAEFAARPNMTPAELQNKLQATDWYRAHTQGELEWNSLAPAEQQKRKDEVASQIVDAWWQFGGQRIDTNDSRVANYVDQIASGKMGIGAFTETVVKASAKLDPTSPYSRQTNDENKAKLQPGVDIENTAQRVKDLSARWGLKWDEKTYQDWGRKITTNEASEADVLDALKQQAAVIYPWKAKDMETMTAAQPWIDTYSRVMEKPGELTNPTIQAALQTKDGTPPWQFEQQLKQSADWLTTKNARSDMFGAAAELGRRMGFS